MADDPPPLPQLTGTPPAPPKPRELPKIGCDVLNKDYGKYGCIMMLIRYMYN